MDTPTPGHPPPRPLAAGTLGWGLQTLYSLHSLIYPSITPTLIYPLCPPRARARHFLSLSPFSSVKWDHVGHNHMESGEGEGLVIRHFGREIPSFRWTKNKQSDSNMSEKGQGSRPAPIYRGQEEKLR